MSLRASTVGELLDALGARTPAPASGAATALTAALAAALVELAARFAGDERSVEEAGALAQRLVELADEDVDAYTAFMAERTPANRAWIVAVPEEIATQARATADLAAHVRAQLEGPVGADADAAAVLAASAAGVASSLAALNA